MKSPKPKKQDKGEMSFPEALVEVLKGKSITKLEWDDKQYFGLLSNERLTLRKPDGKFYDWIVSEGDLRGEDWVCL
jgi:hypothetical protein